MFCFCLKPGRDFSEVKIKCLSCISNDLNTFGIRTEFRNNSESK